jgi:hypothetical protein
MCASLVYRKTLAPNSSGYEVWHRSTGARVVAASVLGRASALANSQLQAVRIGKEKHGMLCIIGPLLAERTKAVVQVSQ